VRLISNNYQPDLPLDIMWRADSELTVNEVRLADRETLRIIILSPVVGLKIEIHEIHQNSRNPVSILIKFHPLQQDEAKII